jgi:hypothetical protein
MPKVTMNGPARTTFDTSQAGQWLRLYLHGRRSSGLQARRPECRALGGAPSHSDVAPTHCLALVAGQRHAVPSMGACQRKRKKWWPQKEHR